MIRLRLTFGTEVFPAIITSNSELSKVLGCFPVYWLALVIFLTHLNFTGDHFHHVSTLAADQTGVVLDEHHKLAFINLLLIVFRQELSAFVICNLLLTAWTAYRFRARHLLNDFFSKAVHVYLMPALRCLKHVKILIQLIIFRYKLVTKHAKTLLSHLLHLLVNGGCSLLLVLTQEIVHVVGLDVTLAA